jgi:hypothetical protein
MSCDTFSGNTKASGSAFAAHRLLLSAVDTPELRGRWAWPRVEPCHPKVFASLALRDGFSPDEQRFHDAPQFVKVIDVSRSS